MRGTESSASWVELFRQRSREQTDRRVFTFLSSGGAEAEHITYGDLDRRAREIAGSLQSTGQVMGERALLLYPPGLEFIAAFFGCLYAGVVAVPSYPPRRRRRGKRRGGDERLRSIARDAEARLILTDRDILGWKDELVEDVPELGHGRWHATDAVDSQAASTWHEPAIDADHLAFLQYTSGSTASPKGVCIRHRHLLANEAAIQRAFELDETAVIVGWLPLYHDMGLIGNVLQPIYLGASCVLMSPTTFLQKPLRWLEAISRYEASVSGGPNFAYDECVRRITPEQRAELDLSSWRVAFNGAEPIRAETLDRFAETFADAGFDRRAFFPCYGLAESTLLVTGAERSSEPTTTRVAERDLETGVARRVEPEEPGRRLVASGIARDHQQVRIVDPATARELGTGEVGEIWLAGPSVADGYWRRPEQTREDFEARLAEDPHQGPFLRTGDLGFLDEGELYVTGRLKDLIILRGRNHYPQDLEHTAGASHEALRPGSAAAFSVERDGEEHLVLVQEIKLRQAASLNAEEVVERIRRAIAETHWVAVSEVVLVRAGGVPRTSSGKVRRRECRRRHLREELPVLATSGRSALTDAEQESPVGPTEARLARIWGEVFELDAVGRRQDFFDLGGDSLRATRLLARVEEAFGVRPALEDLFEYSTVAEQARLVERLDGVPPVVLPPVPREERAPAPLSFSQRRLWFLHQLEPDNPVHNVAAVVRATGTLTGRSLEAAVREILRRHEVLRSRFVSAEDEPLQVVAEGEGFLLPQVDLTQLEASHRGSVARRLRAAVARRPFVLDRGPFLRSALLRLDRQEHEIVFALHHIAADGWSLDILLKEFTSLYEAFRKGQPSPLSELTLQYGDFALWQRRQRRRDDLEDDLLYWRERLGRAPPRLELPSDRPRPAVLRYRGAHLERTLSPALTDALQRLALRRRSTPYMVFLAGFWTFLHRYTGQRDLILGTPASGRELQELEPLMGAFINNLVLRADLSERPDFASLIEQARRVTLEAQAHQALPFERLVDELEPVRDRSRTPLFQIMFVWQNAPLRRARLDGLELLPREVDPGAARFDLSLAVGTTETGLVATWKYSTDLFDRTTVRRMARHLETLLTQAVAAPERRVDALRLLHPSEAHHVLREHNDTRAAFAGGLLHERIARQTERTPDAVALSFGSHHVTYSMLRNRALGVSADLARAGVRPGDRVAICAERSVGLVVGLLGILETGAAYVPLDPEYPAERLAFLLMDSNVRSLLVQESLEDRLPESDDQGPVRLRLGELSAGIEGGPAPPRTGWSRELAAYVIYTSGSTGRPKGAVVSHGAIVNRLEWMQAAYGLGSSDRVLQKTPYSFDVSVWEFFWPLSTGAQLVVAPPGAHQDGTRLKEIIQRHEVTTLHFVPSMLQLFLVESGLRSACASVRRVITSGEALGSDLAERCLESIPAELHNLYGPTEAAVDVTAWPCRPHRKGRPVPIGRPISNLRIHVLDAANQPAALGVPGELHIGGVGLARGYHGRPARTAAAFVPDPFARTPGSRLYRTGDLTRRRADGAVEFLGRLDFQVKVRGFRIELGEIEEALLEHPEIREVVVTARGDGTGERRLVAYGVADGEAPTPADLRAFLSRTLPEYMVPGAFVFLDAMPLTPNGKVDRRALPAPGPERPELGEAFVAPRTELERRLAALWREVLDLEQVGVHDEFFELGGDSIQAALVVNRLQRELGEIVYVMALFDAPSIAELAAHLEQSYPRAVGRWIGEALEPVAVPDGAMQEDRLDDEAALARLSEAVRARLHREVGNEPEPPRTKNPRAVFILSPFRSGSTLLRVLLAGHSRLFSPPELELLAFDTLGRRRAAYSGRDRFAREGLVRAVMELRDCDAEEAEDFVARAESEDWPTGRMYRWLQERAGDRLLVDKTPSYALDPITLRHAEQGFEAPLYIHLVRHPRATIHSYREARFDQIYDFPFESRDQAELVWLACHRNVVDFLSEVPQARWLRIAFEDLVRSPRPELSRVARFLGLELEPAMLEPYAGSRMTDGLRRGSRMMGDPKFHRHREIDPAVADRWREADSREPLRRSTRELAARLGYEADLSVAAPSESLELQPVAGDVERPLSFAQQRLWFLHRLDPSNPAYNMPAAVRLQGEHATLATVLRESFREVVRRHEVLRTVFLEIDGQPVQEIRRDVEVSLPRVDLSALRPQDRSRVARDLARREGRRPFALDRGPMLRARLLRRSRREHWLLATMHHIVADGWSIGVLVGELVGAFRGLAAGRPPDLDDLPIQYADYATWQRRRLQGATLQRSLDFWRQRLGGSPPVLDLPTDRPRPPVQTFRGARRSRTLPVEPTEEVRAWSRGRGTTFFVTLLATFNVLLSRYTGQRDVLLGVPVANRNRVEIEGLIGCFLNMVVQRTDLSGAPTFSRLIPRVQEAFVSASVHQEMPFERLVEELQPKRDLSRPPLFQIQFSLQNTPTTPLELPGLDLELLEIHNGTTKFDFTVFLFDEPGGLRTVLEYNADLFDGTTIERMLRHWQGLLCAGVTTPDRRIDEMPLLTPAEHSQLVVQSHDAMARFPDGPALHRRFEARVEESPEAVAVVCGVDELSYRQLDVRANQLAHRLRRMGVGSETRVGLFLERGIDLVVGVLGILKAGGAYVPLDPAYPPERIGFILQDALGTGADTAPLVTSASLAAGLHETQEWPGTPLVRLDADAEDLAREPVDDPPGACGTDRLAYVIYTSGSTGRPKGVGVSHGNAVRLFTATEPWFHFGPDDVWTLFHSSAFDFSVWELWGALLYGGTLVVVPRDVSRSPAAFYRLLVTEGVTVLNQTPSAFRQLVQLDDEDATGSLRLRWIVFGGEALELQALEPWFRRHGDARPRLVNMYGITETTVHVTYRPVSRDDLSRPGAGPIGRPIPDLAVHLFRSGPEPVPLGVAGEIHVSGEGLARGYLGRPALTASRFVPDPFCPRPGGRLYRSGDLARRRADGELEYLGRLDHQVKIRGFRIELGEIEAALGRHPEIGENVVVVRDDAAGDPRLAAYLVTTGDPALDVGALRRHLGAFLPDYMVPSAFVAMDRLPSTPNGKVDREALPDPEDGRVTPEGREAPQTPVERALAALWQDVLGVDRVGRGDDFFALGGHSLIATRLASRVRETFGVDLPIARIFEHSTLEELAASLGVEGPVSGVDGSSIPKASEGGAVALSYAQERLWFLDRLVPDSAVYNVPVALKMSGDVSTEVLRAALGEVVRRHQVLRTRFPERSGRPVQEIDAPAPMPLSVLDLRALPPQERGNRARRIAAAQAARPFDLTHGPVLRARLIRCTREDHLLVLVLHHTVADGWSLGVLAREVAALYAAYHRGAPSDLPELEIQYADYSVWQRTDAFEERLDAELRYWREQLQGAPRSLDLPLDRPRPPVQRHRGGTFQVVLPETLSETVAALAREHGVTPFVVLLAAFSVLLGRYARQRDLLVGFPIAGRHRLETEPLIGLFVNTLVLRCDLGGDPTFEEVLRRVGEVSTEAHGHQDLPFERLVRELEPDRDLSRSPLFQVMLAMQNTGIPRLELESLRLEPATLPSGTSKFDLQLSLGEDQDRFRGFLEYDRDLFDATTIRRLWRHYEGLLTAAVEEPAERVEDLSFLTPAERAQTVREWNDTAWSEGLPETTLHRLVEERMGGWRDSTALCFRDQWLSYGELERRAEGVAGRLRRLGVGPEIRVPILAERSLELVVGLLGILRAGAAYVPLDPEYPRDRLSFMLSDALGRSGPRVLLTQESVRSRVAASECTVLLLEDALASSAADVEPTVGSVDPEGLAYVIYTSGSTGRPKGVMNAHRGIVNRLLWMQDAYGLSPEDRVLQKTPASFDVSVWEFFWPLLAGARLVVAAPGGHKDPSYLARTIVEEGVTTLHFVPSMLRAFVGEPVERCGSVRRVIASGEALPPDLAGETVERLPGELFNLYGPTEAAVDVTAWPCRESWPESIPIGRPVHNTRIHLVDPEGTPVPVGVPGELVIGGVQVARGYHGRPALTAERFIPDPWARQGERVYRTGDLARLRPGGEIEFLGRLDHQVKVRGLRIELGEIEVALARHPQVEECAVIVGDDGSPGQRLLAYVVAAGETTPAVDGLRRFLTERMPEAMVPSVFVPLDRLPLTPNGKLDRKALPVPTEARPELTTEYAPPRTEAERALADVWSRVLGIDRIGLHDDFFALGGDSILSIQVVSRAREAGWNLTPRDLFRQRTLAELALAAAPREAESAPEVTVPARGVVPLTPVQRWFFAAEPIAPHHFNQSVLLEVRRDLEPELWKTALGRVVRHHDTLRLRFEQRGGVWRQEYAQDLEDPPWRDVDLTDLPPNEQESAVAAICADAQGSFDLGRPPLVRAVWIDLGGPTARLLLVIHHLVVDGVSWRILLEDLMRAYRTLDAGGEPSLPPVTSSFRHWSETLAELAEDPAILAQDDYWTRSEGVAADPLPTGPPNAGNLERHARTATVALDDVETAALLDSLPTRLRASVEEVLLSAVTRALASWTGGSRHRILMEGHGREPLGAGLDVSRTVGWFTSLYPVVFQVPPSAGSLEALAAVKSALHEVPGKGVGYGLLRGGEVTPEPQISFNYLGRLDRALDDDAPLAPAPEPAGPERAPDQTRRHLLDVTAQVSAGRLAVRWIHAGKHFAATTMESVAARCLEALRELVRPDVDVGTAAWVPADFPLADVESDGLGRILARLGPFEDLYRLSPMQEGLLFHSVEDPGSGVYFEQVSAKLLGPLDLDAFRDAWQHLVDRHAVLRSAFVWEESERPLQAVLPRVDLPFELLDWSDLSAPEQEERLESVLADDRRRGFHLDRAPLLRVTVARLGDDRHQWLWSFHHLLLDGWSVPRLISELLSAYQALRQGHQPSFDPVRPYRDYIAWLARRDDAGAEAFWRRRLAGWTEPLELPADRTPAPGEAARFEESVVRLSASRTAELRELGRRWGCTLNTLIQGVWALLLARYTGTDDVLFGSVTSGRPASLPGAESMVGLFINTLPTRMPVPADAQWKPWLLRLQDREAEARELETVPLVRIQRWSEMPPEETLFRTLLVFENYPLDESLAGEVPGLVIEDLRFVEQTHYPWTLRVEPGEHLGLTFGFDATRFFLTTRHRLTAVCRRLLDALLDDPERPISDLVLLSRAEVHQLRVEANDTAIVPAVAPKAPETRFRERLAEIPDAVAVCYDELYLSFAELARRADALARILRRRGVGPDVPVGLVLERGPEQVVALLAAWQAGGAYLPLDPSHPAERIRSVVKDAGCPVVWTREDVRRALAAQEQGATSSRSSSSAPLAPLDSLAYVIYTSGSTGVPKGVGVARRQVSYLVEGLERSVFSDVSPSPPRSRLRASVNAPWTFDASVQQWVQLLQGRTLVLEDEDTRLDPMRLVEHVERHGIDLFDVTPSQLEILAAAGLGRHGLPRRVLVGGEAVGPALWKRLAAHPTTRFVNVYGPTETTVDVTAEHIRPRRPRPNLGFPLPEIRLYVLDRHGRPTFPGVVGELAVGGAGVSRGYLGQPAHTAERFVPDPFGGPGNRLYRTGDLARWRPDGRWSYEGRVDHQVKVRGFRIEPGEIEGVLAQHPEVADVAVLARDDEDIGNPRLVAYLVPSGEAPSADAVRAFAAQRLPSYMVPTAIVFLDGLPLTSHGKLDRRRLPIPASSRGSGSTYERARTQVEGVLTDIWSRVLRVERVGVHDNFFELGGDSILSMQVTVQARKAGWEIHPRHLFERPTIAELAAVVERLETDAAPAEEPLTGKVGLAPIQRWFFGLGSPDPHHHNQFVLLDVTRSLPPARLGMALGVLFRRHDALRLRFAAAADGWEARFSEPGRPPWHHVDLSGLSPGARDGAFAALAEKVQGSLDLDAGPLGRFVLAHRGADEPQQLLGVVHHLAVDAVSWRILLDDLLTVLDRLATGWPLQLPAKGASYRQWVKRLERWTASPELDEEAAFWRELLSSSPAPLPLDGPPEVNLEGAVRDRVVSLDAELTESLLRDVSQAYNTRIQEVLLTALAQTLVRWTGETTVRVDVEGHGRDDLPDGLEGLDLSRTVGWFTVLHPVQWELVVPDDPGASLQTVKGTLRQIPHGGLGYGLLRHLARRDVDPGDGSEVAFNYLGRLDRIVPEDAGLRRSLDPAGSARSPRAPRSHVLEIVAAVVDERLEVRWSYVPEVLRDATVERWSRAYRQALTALIEHCRTRDTTEYSPADFPDVDLDQEALDRVLHEIDAE